MLNEAHHYYPAIDTFTAITYLSYLVLSVSH